MAILDDLSTTIVVGILVIAVSTFFIFGGGKMMKKSSETTPIAFDDLLNSNEQWGGEESSSPVSSADASELKNVFDVHQPPPKVGNEEEKNKDSGGGGGEQKEKPFKSSYYYAHNHLKKTGGYKDGLRAQDYQMNGPKLLSKGGTSVVEEEKKTNDSSDEAKPTRTQAPPKVSLNSIPLNRYLWDDDGNAQGIAKIHITTLPGKSSTSPSTNWEDANISKQDVAFKLIAGGNQGKKNENGLIVQIRASSARYHLYVPRMYGEVDEVKLIVKAKKLIVKLTKKDEESNKKAWPQLPSKVKASSNPNLDQIDYINEDLLT